MLDSIIDYNQLRTAIVDPHPYIHLVAQNILTKAHQADLSATFPNINEPGFFPLDVIGKMYGDFAEFIEELQKPILAEILGEKFGISLVDKPSLITIRKLSALKDGPIHTDGNSKLVTALFYFNEAWPATEEGGSFAILSNNDSFDSTVKAVPPIYGNFTAFVRSENSWHGHKPFEGERKVVQITWVKSTDDVTRKTKRGNLSYQLKTLFKVFKIFKKLSLKN